MLILVRTVRPEVALDFNIVRHFDAQGRKNSVILNWNLFYDTSYDINQITWIHNINVTLQLLSAQKDAYAVTPVNFVSRYGERERERERERRDVLSTARWNTGKDRIHYRFHIL